MNHHSPTSTPNLISKTLDKIIRHALTVGADYLHISGAKGLTVIQLRRQHQIYNDLNLPGYFLAGLLARLQQLTGHRGHWVLATANGKTIWTPQFFRDADGLRAVVQINRLDFPILQLDHLGLAPEDLDKLQQPLKLGRGLLTISGPNDAGLTTTGYSLLANLDAKHHNIITLEDCQETKLLGVHQLLINLRRGLNRLRLLRTITQQDADVVFLSDITEAGVLDAALHLAGGRLIIAVVNAPNLTTLATDLLSRTQHPQLLAQNWRLAINQRLVRRNCLQCLASRTITTQQLQQALQLNPATLPEKTWSIFHGTGCEACQHSGYDGQTGLFEVAQLTAPLQALLAAKNLTDAWQKNLDDEINHSLIENGLAKILQKLTSLEEVKKLGLN